MLNIQSLCLRMGEFEVLLNAKEENLLKISCKHWIAATSIFPQYFGRTLSLNGNMHYFTWQ